MLMPDIQSQLGEVHARDLHRLEPPLASGHQDDRLANDLFNPSTIRNYITSSFKEPQDYQIGGGSQLASSPSVIDSQKRIQEVLSGDDEGYREEE